MKKVLIQSATIINTDLKIQQGIDVLIEDGKISKMGQQLPVPNGAAVLNAEECILSVGFFDLNANFGEPGLETKESLESGCQAALAGGVTTLALMPNTQPALHSKSEISYIVNRSATLPVNIYPVGAISEDRKGENMAELYDMKLAGALAFSDGNRPVKDAGLMSRTLLYAKGFGAKVFSYAQDSSLAGKAPVNEGVMSTLLGLKGNPALAEELMVARDIELAAYQETGLHFSTISSAKSVALIRDAKAKGLAITCDVAAHQLVFTEEELSGFDSNYKVNPPLRTAADRKALLEGLQDGTIDAIVSQHTPHEIEFKAVEFGLAAFGMIGLQTLLPLALKAGLKPVDIVKNLAVNPRKIVGLSIPKIAEGEPAELVLFDPKAKWVYDQTTNYSKSANSPLMGQELCGKVIWCSTKNQYYNS